MLLSSVSRLWTAALCVLVAYGQEMTLEKQTEAPIVNQDHELKIKDSAMNLWSYLGSLSSKLG